MSSDAIRATLVALQDQIRAQALPLKKSAEANQTMAEAQRRLAEHPDEHRQIVRAMRWAAPGITLANIDEDQLSVLLAYQPPTPL